MKNIFTISILCSICFCVKAQKENLFIAKGNEAYRQKQYGEAAKFYQQALAQSPGNTTAAFNLGNALYRGQQMDEAEKAFDNTVKVSKGKEVRADAWYNKGVTYTNEKKLQESIDAYKEALRLNPTDSLARENLQRALNEQKKQQQQQQKNQKNKEQQKQQQQNKSKLSKQQVQQLLQALEQQEKNLQQKMQQTKVPSPGQPEKDW